MVTRKTNGPAGEGTPPKNTTRKNQRVKRAERLSPDLGAIIQELETLLRSVDPEGRRPFSARCGIYAFYDFDDEPIYVGQTRERLQVRIRRHLTNQRTDAVAMHVLDPLEVATVEAWPFWDLEHATKEQRKEMLDRGESTVYKLLMSRARVSRLLNEKIPADVAPIELPSSHKGRIIPEDAIERLYHPDERIARRAGTIASLTQVIKERDVSLGLRETLVTQAQRLEHLARKRHDEVRGETPPDEVAAETVRKGEEEPAREQIEDA